MEKEFNFTIKKGVYCSWCANLMKRTLIEHFKIKEIEIDIIKEKVHIVPQLNFSVENRKI